MTNNPFANDSTLPQLHKPGLNVLCVCISDVHLSLHPPVARSVEANWLDAFAQQLKQLKHIAQECQAPVICAGDLFDRYNPPPELVNYALAHLPKLFSVYGQHDLSHHRSEDLHRSAYWTLCEAGKVKDISLGNPRRLGRLVLYGFPWNAKLKPRIPSEDDKPDDIHVAVIHKYAWIAGHCFYGADDKDSASVTRKALKGYDVVVSGDNHAGFIYQKPGKKPILLNNGVFVRRRIDEQDYQPCVGLIYSDGSVARVPLDVSQDKFITLEDWTSESNRADDLIQDLSTLGDAALDFAAALKNRAEQAQVSFLVQSLMLKALES